MSLFSMNMTIQFYTISDDHNVVNKSLSGGYSVTGQIKENCSISAPEIIIDFGANTQTAASKYNYCYIADFGRYYYITDMQFKTGHILSISCRCDVLMSFKTEILNTRAVVSRQESKFNLYLQDGAIKTLSKSKISYTKPTGSGFGNYSYMLLVAGGD